MYALPIREKNPRFFKVPAQQRRVNKEAYEPLLFSFGPYHAGTAHLRDGEHFKRLVANQIMKSEHDCLETLVGRIQEHESKLRDLYIQMSEAQQEEVHHALLPGELAKCLALDSVLIVSAALEAKQVFCYFIESSVVADALLLENQVPIFVLKYALQSLRSPYSVSLQDVLDRYLSNANPFLAFKPSPETEITVEANSLLGYVYDYLTEAGRPINPGEQLCPLNPYDFPMLPTASRLARCGLKFKPCDSSFRGIKFIEKKMELLLPSIVVCDYTPRLLHNLLAYEATVKDGQFPVCSWYIYVMDRLIDTKEDVQVLVDAKVISNWLGSHEELAASWNRLCTNVTWGATDADRETLRRVVVLTEKRWRRWRAALKEKYLENQPWLIISIIAATVLLVLTLLQTIYTIKGFFGQ